MTTTPIPRPSVRLVQPDGTMDREWYDYFLSRDRIKITDLRDVSTATSATNGQVLIFSGSTNLWRPGAN